MKAQNIQYELLISFILIIAAASFSFYYIYKVNDTNNNIRSINCQELNNLYNQSYYKTIEIKVYLTQNCTINNLLIPEGNRIIYIYEGNISYI
ncbi:hypothetical protein MJ1_0113 [Nanobdella aerobiophila]|uniref:Uncharacterized protein n=1 Tax=Nanobdella aerobiophila TaxID=2586965 RepID=A0A915WR86_9ARCH|nr:hypothetical protein [Nanobdella aerobiophila]BBL45288.1 hypothetical protein MJ1_0113 [Nanobdella aerobiophila]